MDTEDEPVTPTGRLFVQPEIGQVIHCLIGGKDPIDIEAVKSVIRESIMAKHHRFCSLMVTDCHGRERWRKTAVDVDRHVIVLHEPMGDDDEQAANDYVTDLAVSSALGTDKPLWEVHLLMAHNCAVLRLHHALGDGVSLMSMLSCCCSVEEPAEHLYGIKSMPFWSHRRKNTVWGLVKTTWLTLIYIFELLKRILWIKDKRTPVSGGAGVELWQRKLATAKFLFDDMQTVKKAVPHATINDVLCGVISSGLSRYMDIRSSEALEEGFQITGVAMVNLRPQPGLQDMSKLMENDCTTTTWVNKFGMILLPVYYLKRDQDPLHYVKTAKETNDRKKQSLESYFSYKIFNFIMSVIGPKLASFLTYRIMCSTSFTISNMAGPRKEITIAGNPIKFIRVTSTSLPHAITMHMVTYARRADMQILAAKDMIPDPQLLAKCFEDALLDMKEAAAIRSSRK